MKIVVLEKIEFTVKQKQTLDSLGSVVFYDSSNESECKERVRGADVVVIDWIDPNGFLSEMKNPSLLALMSTGYSWIDIKMARNLGISVSNVPGYATEAVAEHIIGLMFAVARKTMVGDKEIKKGNKNKGYLQGIEIAGCKAGIIGLGRIGSRVAQILACLGAEVSDYDINSKNVAGVKNASLDELLKNSDFVFVTCSLNESSKSLLAADRLKLMKKDAILLGTTWGVVDLPALIEVLQDDLICGAGFDVSIEGGDIVLPKELTDMDNVVLTPHIGYNTKEAKIRQADICISNIEQYLMGKTSNIVN
jgi:phosphoglycerate dehydrogenase-like enzyme